MAGQACETELRDSCVDNVFFIARRRSIIDVRNLSEYGVDVRGETGEIHVPGMSGTALDAGIASFDPRYR